MTPTPAPPTRFCKACRVPLETTVTPSAFGPRVTYGHPYLADHAPDPVPAEEVTSPVYVCDFCTDPHPVTTFPTTEGAVMAPNAAGVQRHERAHNGESGWAACATCTNLVTNGKAAALCDRAVDNALASLPPGIPRDARARAILTREVMVAHGSFHQMRTGEPGRPWPTPTTTPEN